MSEITAKIEKDVANISSACEKLVKCLDSHLADGIQEADAHEVGEVADAIKDLADAKEKMVKVEYYTQIIEAMQEADYGTEYDINGAKFYRGRNALGQYTHRKGYKPVDMRDMDRHNSRMYFADDMRGYDEGVEHEPRGYEEDIMVNNRKSYEEGHRAGYNEGYQDGKRNSSRYENAKRGYEEAKENMDKDKKMQSLQEMLTTFHDDITARMPKMDMQEKQLVKTMLQNIINRA